MAQSDAQFRYQQIAQEIRARIRRGEIAPGKRLDSERELGRQFGVQRNTVRQALGLLEEQGHVSRGRHGCLVSPAATPDADVLLLSIHSGSAPNLSALVDGFGQAAHRMGYRVRRQSNNPPEGSSMNLAPDPDALEPDVAGLLIWPHFPTDAEHIRRLNDRLPIVLVDQRITGVSADCVRFDDVAGGKLVTRRLLQMGHRKIAFLTDEVFAETVQGRWLGYVLAHEEAGLGCDPRLSMLYQFLEADVFEPTMRHLLDQRGARPTAVVCSNDVVAFSLLRFLYGEGVRVPEEIAVTGYGNSMPQYTAAISLTTVDQNFFEVGREAAELLCRRIAQSAGGGRRAPQEVVLPVRLVARGSSGSDLAGEPELGLAGQPI